MRELSLIEAQSTSGASPEAFIAATTLIAAGIIIGSMPSTSYYYSYDPFYYDPFFYDPYPVSYDVITPVYDSYGYYQGDMIDTYTYW